MTVTDLIRYLEKLPKDTVIGVVYQACSDYSILDENDMIFIDKTRQDEIEERRKTVGWFTGGQGKRYVVRNGNIMEYDEKTWPKEETPHFVPILVLPGN